ncbi:MAG: TolC family protein [Phycisphaerales bacterium]|nr:MAG: TolC family protein [Phycisphaerales bacterium]
MDITRLRRFLMLTAVGGLMGGCQGLFDSPEAEQTLQQYVEAAIDREVAALPAEIAPLTMAERPSPVEEALAQRREELDQIGPPLEPDTGVLDSGPDLTGADQAQVAVALESVILSAVRNNLGVQASSLQPAITAEDIIAAEAVFDWLLLGDVGFVKTDQPQTVPVINNIPLGSAFMAAETYRFETGVRRTFTGGGQLSLTTDLMRNNNRSTGIGFSPNPAYDAALRLGLTQPLLRGFGREVNTATIRLAEHAQQRSVEQLRADLLDVVQRTESAYWTLVFAWRNLAIQQWMVDEGVKVRDILERRMDFDTRLAEYADAVATVEQRKANVIRAQRRVRAASDALKALINDPALTVGSEALLTPAEDVAAAPITYSLREAILAAVANRPEVHQAALVIEDAKIGQLLADNQRLPLLNLSAQMAYFGLDDGVGDSYDQLSEGSFIDYIVGLSFEYPFGNRGAEAGFRQARLQRTASIIAYRQVVQNAVLEVKDALRDVITNYDLIQATRSFRVAQAENLRALAVEEETLAGLTPEFLNLKFQRQSGLALAQAQEVQALVNYRQSVANLYRAMGTGLTMKGIDLEIIDDPDMLPAQDASDR